MAKAKILVKRRKSIRNTRKITRTMEMVSTARYKQSHSRIARSEPYQKKLRELMADLASAGAEISHPLLAERDVRRSVLLLITSNRGLCGGYNTNLIHLARKELAEERAAGIAVELEIIGKKGIRFFRYLHEDVAAEHEQIDDRAGYDQINALADTYIHRFSEAEIDRVTIVYQRFFSAGVQKPVAEALLPLAAVSGEDEGEKEPEPAEKEYLFSPDPASLLRELLPVFCRSALYDRFLQAVVGEHLARMIAMKNATDAADKMIRALTRRYNRARQGQITNEISELMGGVEALK
jgi:F-type H+-transporting ATPase subunit gamma